MLYTNLKSAVVIAMLQWTRRMTVTEFGILYFEKQKPQKTVHEFPAKIVVSAGLAITKGVAHCRMGLSKCQN